MTNTFPPPVVMAWEMAVTEVAVVLIVPPDVVAMSDCDTAWIAILPVEIAAFDDLDGVDAVVAVVVAHGPRRHERGRRAPARGAISRIPRVVLGAAPGEQGGHSSRPSR